MVTKRHGPLVVGVADQLRHPGSQRRVHVTAPLSGLAISTARVPDGTEVDLEVAIEALADGRITVTGWVGAPFEGTCRRCLEPVAGRAEAKVQEVFESAPVEGETYPLVGEQLDLEPLVRDAVLLSLPLAPLCRFDCPGPDPEHHPVVVATDPALAPGSDGGHDDDLDDVGGEDDDPPSDPRWAALRELRFDGAGE